MYDNFSFQQPLHEEPDGTYITVGQLQFFLNRKDGEEKFKTSDAEFIEYYNLCRVYNVVSKIMEDDEDAAIMFWDEKKQLVSLGFPEDGEVASTLSKVEKHSTFHKKEKDGDEFGLFEETPWNED